MASSDYIFSLGTGRYLEKIPDGCQPLKENYTANQSSYDQIPPLVSAITALVAAISSTSFPPVAADDSETFAVREAAKRLGCSPGLVRKLVHAGELGHHWLGRSLRFRQGDLDDFWASQTVARRGKKTRKRKQGGERRSSGTKREKKGGVSSPIPTREEIRNLWQ